jgi:hypothetical protein
MDTFKRENRALGPFIFAVLLLSYNDLRDLIFSDPDVESMHAARQVALLDCLSSCVRSMPN